MPVEPVSIVKEEKSLLSPNPRLTVGERPDSGPLLPLS